MEQKKALGSSPNPENPRRTECSAKPHPWYQHNKTWGYWSWQGINKILCENINRRLTLDGNIKTQVIEANKSNSIRISTNEVTLLRKHFEDKIFKVYVTRTNMTGVVSKNGWELAQQVQTSSRPSSLRSTKQRPTKKPQSVHWRTWQPGLISGWLEFWTHAR